MITAYKQFFKNYTNFSGRTSVKDYWLVVLANIIISFVFGLIMGTVLLITSFISEDLTSIVSFLFYGVLSIYSLALLIPGIAISVRRLHDSGKSGLLLLACYLGTICCGIGSIVQIILMCMPGTPGNNQYGPDPNNKFNEFYAYDNNQYGGNNQQF